MAARSGHHTGVWGPYLAVAQLPNTSGADEQDRFLRKGDIGTVIVSGVATAYICTTPTLGAGVWSEINYVGKAQANTAGKTTAAGGAPVHQWNHSAEGVITARGTDGVSVAGTIYYGGWIPQYNQTVTNVNVLSGSTYATDKIIVGIYSVAGVLLANSALAGILCAGADAYDVLALTSTYAVVADTEYLVAIQLEGTTAQVQRAATGFRVGTGRTGSQTGAFGTLAAISSVSTTFTTALAPLFFVD